MLILIEIQLVILLMVPRYNYNEIAIIDKGSGGITVLVGTRFDSKVVNKKRNPSGISYYIDGYDIRNWCFAEELRKFHIFDYVFKFFKRRKYEQFIKRNNTDTK